MALLEQDLECSRCGKIFDGVRALNKNPEASYELLCGDCLNGVENDAKRKWLRDLQKGKTLEQRVEWLEEFIYYVVNEMETK